MLLGHAAAASTALLGCQPNANRGGDVAFFWLVSGHISCQLRFTIASVLPMLLFSVCVKTQ